MEKKRKEFWIMFIAVVIALILVISLNYNTVDSFIRSNVEDYGYPAIFIFSFLCDTIDQPIVPELPSILGVLYGLNILYVFLIASAGISLIGLINFNIGKKVFGKKIKSLCKTKKYKEYCNFFHKYGKFSLLIAALTPLPYVTFVWLSGAFRMKFKTFFVFGMCAKVLRLGIVLLIYYLILLP